MFQAEEDRRKVTQISMDFLEAVFLHIENRS